MKEDLVILEKVLKSKRCELTGVDRERHEMVRDFLKLKLKEWDTSRNVQVLTQLLPVSGLYSLFYLRPVGKCMDASAVNLIFFVYNVTDVPGDGHAACQGRNS